MDKLEITDELLFKHCPNVEKFIIDQIPNEEDLEYTYPESFEIKIRKIIKQENSNKYSSKFMSYSKKVAVVLIAITISLFTVTMSVDALRDKLFSIIKNAYEKFTVYKLTFEGDDQIEKIEEKNINYLPKGFKEVERYEYSDSVTIMYSNGIEHIIYNYFIISNNNLHIDTEDADISDVLIGNIKAEYIEKDNMSMLVWQDEKQFYNLRIEHNDNNKKQYFKDELINIVKNIK